MRVTYLILFFIGLANVLQAQDHICYVHDARASERDHQIDISHMKVEVAFEPKAGKVKGKVSHTFTSLRESIDTLFFDAPAIDIESVELNGKKVKYSILPEGVVLNFKHALTWEKEYEVVIEYTAYPRKGIYFIGWNAPEHNDPKQLTRRQIWTQGQGIDNRYWIPMYDDMNDKFVTETIITFNKEYKVLSNGTLLNKKEKGNTITWHYKLNNPHAGYLLMLAIDKFAVKETVTSRGTPVQFWYYPESPEKLEPTSMHTEKIIEFLEDETGVPYVWGTYAQVMVQDFMYGAMENTSATIFGDFFFVDKKAFHDRNYIGVNAHELTHQWFGDLITARSSSHAWLQESFATYYAKLFFSTLEGEDAVKWEQRKEVNNALNASKKDKFPIMHSSAGSSRIYSKGSTVLQMMRYVMGAAHFKKAINHFVKQYSFKNCDTDDFRKAIIDATGMNMDWFFEQWVKKGGEPFYNVSYSKTTLGTQISVEQIQDQDPTIGLFKMPIQFAVYYKDGTKERVTKWIEKRHTFVTVPNEGNKEVAFVLFDENSEITKKVRFEKSFEELSAQLLVADKMIDRYDAVLAMQSMDLVIKEETLLKVFKKEKFWAIRAEIASQLANNQNNAVTSMLYKDAHAGVRKALILDLKANENSSKILLLALKDSSYKTVEYALQKIMKSDLEKSIKTKAMNATMMEVGHMNNVKIAWLENAINFYPEENYQFKTLLKDYASNSYEFRTRTAAMAALKRLNLFDESVLSSLIDASISTNRRLAGPARGVYSYFASQPDFGKKIKLHFATKKYDKKTLNLIEAAGLMR